MRFSNSFVRSALFTFTVLLCVTAAAPAQDSKSSMGDGYGLVANSNGKVKDIGLSVYPGARPQKDSDNDSAVATLGLWGPSSGFHLSLMKFETGDSKDKVAAFYRKELAKYGKVLDCGDPAAPRGKKGNELTCEDDHPDKDEVMLKAGTKQNQHIVGISEKDGATRFQLIHLETKGSD
ncbi:MAG TPA: hypothetical protein VF135_05605 [Terriglobales bacterium]